MPVSRYRVADDDADRRVDRVLRRLYPGLPLSRLYRALRTGAVMINHERARPDRRTRVGDELAVDLPTPVRAQEGSLGDEPALQLPDLPVVAENDGVRIVNKPAGLRMHGAGDTVVARTRATLGSQSLSFLPSPVHQLDRITSGALVIAKTLAGAREWSQLLQERLVRKWYLAVVNGHCRSGEWTDQLVFDHATGVARVAAQDLGEQARLRCTAVAAGADRGTAVTLLLILLETGRRHQIRAQAAARGHVLFGDRRYGSAASTPPLLHAWRLAAASARQPIAATAPLLAGQTTRIRTLFGAAAVARAKQLVYGE